MYLQRCFLCTVKQVSHVSALMMTFYELENKFHIYIYIQIVCVCVYIYISGLGFCRDSGKNLQKLIWLDKMCLSNVNLMSVI